MLCFRILTASMLVCLGINLTGKAQEARQAPPGLFKDLDDELLGDAHIIRGKQLFIDDHLIDEVRGLTKKLNQPKKHPQNPVLLQDRPWEDAGPSYGTVIYDQEERLFKMWYEVLSQTGGTGKISETRLCYATSSDGIHWDKPLINTEQGTNVISPPDVRHFMICAIFKDRHERDPQKRYKIHYVCSPDGSAPNAINLPEYFKSLQTNVGWSADGLHWTAAPEAPHIPFSDSPSCPFWDVRQQKYVSYLRYGPPNTRKISRIESDDFLHWSPKITVLKPDKIDAPLATQFYQTSFMPYEGAYVGLVTAYHGESLLPIPDDKPWMDRKNIQLAYSRNGLTWNRVGRNGALSAEKRADPAVDWKQEALDAAFIPYGEIHRDWDWGTISTVYSPEPIVVGDEIYLYYTGINAKNWWTFSGDPPKQDPSIKEPKKGVGLARLRLDGFVSVEGDGALTTKTLVFCGDKLEVNADAEGGMVRIEALDATGAPIAGFGIADCDPIQSDNVRHIVAWKGNSDCQLLQGRPIRLRFHLQKAKLFAFAPRIKLNHYLPSYD